MKGSTTRDNRGDSALNPLAFELIWASGGPVSLATSFGKPAITSGEIAKTCTGRVMFLRCCSPRSAQDKLNLP